MSRQLRSPMQVSRFVGYPLFAVLTLLTASSVHSYDIETVPAGGDTRNRVETVGIFRFGIPRIVPSEPLNGFQDIFDSLLSSGLKIQGMATNERYDQFLADVDRELGRRTTACVDRNTAVQVGRKLGFHWVLTGVVEEAAQSGDSARITIRAKLINVETGALIELKPVVGESGSRLAIKLGTSRQNVHYCRVTGREPVNIVSVKNTPLYPAIMRAAIRLGREIITLVPPVRGKVLALPEKDEVLINEGTIAGVKRGTKFVIYRETPITSPDGTIAGYRRKELGEGVALDGQVDENHAILKVTSRLGAGVEIAVGDYARRRPLTDAELNERLDEERKTAEAERKRSKPFKKEK